ncbi:putative Flagellin [Candidatus Sulfopaludibacter sp. SbA3]|nr:putative Flagellin [Candidatus Sulfopaludibacter sp. SbA3]
MLSIQTNVNSMIAQENLGVNNAFQAKTIQRLTSGYRINSSADDAAGLAVANQFRNSIAELTQGVQNANNGVGTLQIIDGGLSNISQMLDRLKTLATESGSGTFTGNRATVNNEYQTLLGEIDRQATNINLNSANGATPAGSSVTNLQTYIGGASSADSNAQVGVNLSSGAVDTKGLKLNGTSVIGGGVSFGGDTRNLNDPSATFLKDPGANNQEVFTFTYVDQNGNLQSNIGATVNSTTTGYTGQQAVAAVNTALATAGIEGITASIGSNGNIQFGGNVAFRVNETQTLGDSSTYSNITNATTKNVYNNGVYTLDANWEDMTDISGGGTGAAATQNQVVSFSVGGQTFNATINMADTTATQAAADINGTAGLKAAGIFAIVDGGTTTGKVLLTSASAFTVNNSTPTDNGGLFGAQLGPGSIDNPGAAGNQAVTAPVTTSTVTGQATNAINAIDSALSQLGVVQGTVGAGENQLNYAISLAQSQITNFSSAQSQIRDADVAAEAANLSKSQVLQQASIAAMAQANSAPQQVLTLLRG